MGKKGGKGETSAAKAAQKAAKRAKQENKAAKTENKRKTKTGPPQPQPQQQQQQAQKGKGKGGGKGGNKGGNKGKNAVAADDDDDLDALLKRFRETWENEHKTTEERVGQAPSRRANATLTPCPHGTDLYLFGGEYFDGDRAVFFPDLFRYTPATGSGGAHANAALDSSDEAIEADAAAGAGASGGPVDRGTWRSYSSPTQPGPRSAHQMAATAANGGQLWLFGGEFAGMRMTSFHHYRDLWVFHIATKQWERIDTKVRPSARSGHRMVCWKQFLILFGGFQDTGARTQYLGDLWIFDLSEYKWHEVQQNALRKPSSRSGFSLLACPEGVILHGGYCKRYVKGQRTQGVALEDTWLLRLTLGEDGDLFHSGSIEWQRRRKIGYAPGPRSGCTMALWGNRNMGVLFGGVVDMENDEESLESQSFNDLFGYQLAGNGRWISLNLRRPKKKAGGRRRRKVVQQPQVQERKWEQNSDDEENDEQDGEEVEKGAYDNHSKEPATGNGRQAGKGVNGSAAAAAADGGADSDDDPDDPQKSVPIPRFNTMLAVQRNTLYFYGGIHETADREYTMDDFYTLDLSKMDRYRCLKACPIDALEWNESESSDDGDDDDEDDSSSSSSDEDDKERRKRDAQQPEGEEFQEEEIREEDYDPLMDEEGLDDETLARLRHEREEREALRKRTQAFLGVSKGTTAQSEEDVLSTPQPGETLRDFYSRSQAYWSRMAFQQSEGAARGKEMRRDGFELAEKRFADLKPVLDEIRRIQREAGLDDDELKAASGKAGGTSGGTGVESRNRR